MRNGMQLTLDGHNGRAGQIVSLMTVSIIWDQEPGEDSVIITRQVYIYNVYNIHVYNLYTMYIIHSKVHLKKY